MPSSTRYLSFRLLIIATCTLASRSVSNTYGAIYPGRKIESPPKKFDIDHCLSEEEYKSISYTNIINITDSVTNNLADRLDELARKIEGLPKKSDIDSMINKLAHLTCNSPVPTTTVPTTTVPTTTVPTTTVPTTQEPTNTVNSDCVGGVIIAGKCLTFSTEKLLWKDAKKTCSTQNGSLVTLNDPQALKTYVASNYDHQQHFWLGGSDIINEGTWVWLNGQPLGDQFPWHTGEPTALMANEDCLLFWGGYQLLDAPCDRQYRYVCEKGSHTSA